MKYVKLMIVFLISITLTGCVSYTELNETAIIDAILIDKTDNKYIVTINMLTPTKDDLEEKKTYTSTNESLDKCLSELYLSTTKKIAFSHLELLAITPNIQKEELKEIINLFLNRVDSRNTFSTIVITNQEKLFDYDVEDINELIDINHNERGIVSIKQFDSMIKDILEMNISYVPRIKIEDELVIEGYQSVYGENKLLSIDESIGYNFITNNIKQGLLNINDIGIKLNTSNTNIKVNKNKIDINITSSYQVLNNNENKSDKEINKSYHEALEKYMNEFIDNNKLNYFDKLVEKYQYDYYKNNKDLKLEFDIHITSTKIENSNIKGGNSFE